MPTIAAMDRRKRLQDDAAMPANPFRERRAFVQWLKASMVDLITMAILGAISLALFLAPQVTKRSFPLTFEDGTVVYPQFAYPYRDQFIPNWAAALLAVGVPLLSFGIMQVRLRSFWDFHNAMLGLLYALLFSSLFQLLLKWSIGGLRPHFYDVCRPDPALASSRNSSGFNGVGYGNIFYNRDICTNPSSRSVTNELQSFPSGHSASYFASSAFLSLYLNAKLKVFANYQPAAWKLLVVYAPIFGAAVVSALLVVDSSHNWYDVVAGGILGGFIASTTYRAVFAAVFDWRYNHIPLVRGRARVRSDVARCQNTAVVTKKAGWTGGGESSTVAERHPEGGRRQVAQPEEAMSGGQRVGNLQLADEAV